MIYETFDEKMRALDKEHAQARKVKSVSPTAVSLRRQTSVALVLREFSDALAEEYLPVDLSIEQRNQVFARAWETGHAYGLHEVEQEYIDLAEFVSALLKS